MRVSKIAGEICSIYLYNHYVIHKMRPDRLQRYSSTNAVEA